jgi:two-component system, LytTR family, response regulator
MSKIRCIIMEDEPLAAKMLAGYISEVPFLDLKGIFRDAILASDFLRNHQVDLIFLDIHLPRMKGMDFLKTLHEPPAVIVTTAYHQYAVQGYEMNVTDYLLKPFEFERFLVAVAKVKPRTALPQDANTTKDSIFLNIQKKKVRVMLNEILYVESQREYIRVVTTKTEFMVKLGTHDIEAILPPTMFRRIHRSFIISLGRIESYTSEMVEIGGTQIPIGRAYRDVTDTF